MRAIRASLLQTRHREDGEEEVGARRAGRAFRGPRLRWGGGSVFVSHLFGAGSGRKFPRKVSASGTFAYCRCVSPIVDSLIRRIGQLVGRKSPMDSPTSPPRQHGAAIARAVDLRIR